MIKAGHCAKNFFTALALCAPIGCGGGSDSDDNVVTVTSCSEAFSTCGGDPTGKWRLSSLCVEGTTRQALDSGLGSPNCDGTFTDATIVGSGQITYSDSNYTRSGSLQITAKLRITPACFADQLNGVVLTESSCTNFQYAISSTQPGTTASCSYDGTNCLCDTKTTEPIDQTGTYSVASTRITETNGNSYDFCVNGKQMSQRGQIGSNLAGVALWSKQ